MNKFTKLDDEIISVLGQDGALQEKGGLLAREVFALCQFAGDEEEVRVALNAMVKRGEIVRDKDKLYSFADKKGSDKGSDVVVESSETKKEEPILDILDRHARALDYLSHCEAMQQVVVDRIKGLYSDPEFRKFVVAYGKAGNDPSN